MAIPYLIKLPYNRLNKNVACGRRDICDKLHTVLNEYVVTALKQSTLFHSRWEPCSHVFFFTTNAYLDMVSTILRSFQILHTPRDTVVFGPRKGRYGALYQILGKLTDPHLRKISSSINASVDVIAVWHLR